jgi:hypothetical protein
MILEQHIFRSGSFKELIGEAVHFFNGTPMELLPPSDKFAGPGIYAIYYNGKSAPYKNLYKEKNNIPIYVGKAALPGWRQGRIKTDEKDAALYRRLREHSRSISSANNLMLDDFSCRFVVVSPEQSDLIGTIEAALVRKFNPLWNSYIDGFGNHDPGKGRYNQAKSEWDVLHVGRKWAERLNGEGPLIEAVLKKVEQYADI